MITMGVWRLRRKDSSENNSKGPDKSISSPIHGAVLAPEAIAQEYAMVV